MSSHSRNRNPNTHRSEVRTTSQDQRDRRDRHRYGKNQAAVGLPFGVSPLSKHDLHRYEPMFGHYLDIQKQIAFENLTEDEIKGRWKSFVGKWNRGELAEGWYDPLTLQKCLSRVPEADLAATKHQRKRKHESDDEDDFGPALPSPVQVASHSATAVRMSSAAVPTADDIRAREQVEREEFHADQARYRRQMRAERLTNHQVQKERLEDLAPRAEPGTRERQLEKRREINTANKSFAAAKSAGGHTELSDSQIMGDDDSLSDLKRRKLEQAKKKNEREIRREQALRARQAERDEKLKVLREKEEKTMGELKRLAEARFGKVSGYDDTRDNG